MANKRILIIEDNDDVAEMLSVFFAHQYDVYHADTGPTGVEMARTRFPNLILLDVMLPEMDGYDVCQALRQKALTRYIPIIFLTQKDERSSKVRGLELGADDYITKPFDIDELRLRVRNSIDAATRDHLHEIRTGLPTGPLIEEEIERRKKAGEACMSLYFSIDAFQPYMDVYGFMAANEVMNYAARAVREIITEQGTPHDFVGIRSDQFVVLTHTAEEATLTELQQSVGKHFAEGIRAYYTFSDVERGQLLLKMGTAQQTIAPLMTFKAHSERAY
ncbi:MAG: response regulator [Burkholderiales bacterium]|nr:response regulator [Anaerolineae bacterium]